MPTEFNDDTHYALFKGPGAIRTGNSFEVRWSEITLAALRSAGFLDNMIDGLVPPTTDKLWLDKNFDPAVLKEYNPVGAAWEQVTSQTLFGRLPFRGDWDDEPIYRVGDLVRYGVNIWIATLPSQNHAPVDDAYWDVFIDGSGFLNPSTGQYRIPSFVAAAAAVIPLLVNQVTVEAYDPNPLVPATMVGTAQYTRVAADPGHALSFENNGWWEISETVITIEHCGAYAAAADNAAALTRAALFSSLSKETVHIPKGTFNVNGAFSIYSDTVFKGLGAVRSCVIKNVATASGSTVPGNNLDRVSLSGFTIDGGRSVTHTTGWPITLTNCRDCEIENMYFVNAPSETIVIRDGSLRCKVRRCVFEIQGNGSGHIYLLNGGDGHEVYKNYFKNSVGGCIWLSGDILNTTIVENWCDTSAYELIGVRYGCNGGLILGNRARQTGDNGISVTGDGWVVCGNTCHENAHNGIGLYGSANTVFGNQLRDNGKTGGTQYSGLLLQAAFGGLCQSNNVQDNIMERKAGLVTEQQYGIRAIGLSYSAWATATAVSAGDFRYNAGKLYEAQNSGTTGATAPTHTSGTASDGTVNWKYCGATTGTSSIPRVNKNTVRGNNFINQPVDFNDGSGDLNNFDQRGQFTPVLAGVTSAGAGTYNQQQGEYHRVDNEVSIYIGLSWTAHTGTGAMKVTGLPFTCKSGQSPAVEMWINGILWGGTSRLEASMTGGTTEVLIQMAADNGSVVGVTMDTSGVIQLNFKYLIA
ncbi:parallel beta-helix repeat protein [Neorhizobium sp. 2083]|uniref:right-handed parallel beta-helix repeat-containing protein n=1 Tax=Neorhizobium sp. 2083 TaxID=2817762 RepID=UPI002857BAA0|nr:right-handed parallel beta-helix repeat-containing protein [Neorhizobium sp. 2083]MDR6818511.1 parallel beta-helix repeat protein [Neorhizobium sp. 2083]